MTHSIPCPWRTHRQFRAGCNGESKCFAATNSGHSANLNRESNMRVFAHRSRTACAGAVLSAARPVGSGGGAMKPALCPCGAPAEYSVCVLVSSLGLRPRRQKCGRANYSAPPVSRDSLPSKVTTIALRQCGNCSEVRIQRCWKFLGLCCLQLLPMLRGGVYVQPRNSYRKVEWSALPMGVDIVRRPYVN